MKIGFLPNIELQHSIGWKGQRNCGGKKQLRNPRNDPLSFDRQH